MLLPFEDHAHRLQQRLEEQHLVGVVVLPWLRDLELWRTVPVYGATEGTFDEAIVKSIIHPEDCARTKLFLLQFFAIGVWTVEELGIEKLFGELIVLGFRNGFRKSPL